jgi:Fe2+ or Zn2+ uptake regulation protein
MTRANDIRKEILFQAFAKRPLFISASSVQKQCRKEQMDYSLAEIARELPFLVGEKLIEKAEAPGVTEMQYVITSAGIRHYEQTYAA